MSKEVRLTHHARANMDARSISFQEVLDVIDGYHHRYSSFMHRGRPTPDTYVYQRGQLALVIKEFDNTLLVKTVLLADRNQWSDEDARTREKKDT